MRKRNLAVFTAALLLLGGFANAQSKNAPIRFVVPYPAGGGADQVTRMVANEVSNILKRPAIVENKVGASGMIGAEYVLRHEADGTMFYIGTNAPLVINQAIYKKIPYEPTKDFEPVAGLAKVPLLMVANKNLGITSIEELAAKYKKDNKEILMGSAGSGNITHLAGENTARVLGYKVAHIPFSGTAPAMTNLLSGTVDVMFDGVPGSLAHINSGRITPILYLDKERSTALPQTPTPSDLGLKNMEAAAWYGVVAKKGTPQESIEEMNRVINQALQSSEVQEKLASMHYKVIAGSAKEFGDFIQSERAIWYTLAKNLEIQVD